MTINTGERRTVTYFIGTEVEHTPMYGERTLFVVGVQPVIDIINIIKEQNLNTNQSKHIRHVYLGSSQSFAPAEYSDWEKWNTLILELLDVGYWVTLDFGVEYADLLHEYGWNENHRFIPMISVKIPCIKLYNYNATLKIDDTSWGATNSGVWCHSLHNLMDRKIYTDWKDYVGDEVIK